MKDYRTMFTRHLDIHASVDLVRLVQDAGISTEELTSMAAAAPPGPQQEDWARGSSRLGAEAIALPSGAIW